MRTLKDADHHGFPISCLSGLVPRTLSALLSQKYRLQLFCERLEVDLTFDVEGESMIAPRSWKTIGLIRSGRRPGCVDLREALRSQEPVWVERGV